MFSFNQWNVAGIVFVGQHYDQKTKENVVLFSLCTMTFRSIEIYRRVYTSEWVSQTLAALRQLFSFEKRNSSPRRHKNNRIYHHFVDSLYCFSPPVMICYVFFFIFYSVVCLERYSSTRLLTLSRGGETTNHSNTNEKNKRHSRHFYCCI